MLPPKIKASRDRKWQVWVTLLAAGVTGQVIVKGLSNIPWFFNVKVRIIDMIGFVNDAWKEYRKKLEQNDV